MLINRYEKLNTHTIRVFVGQKHMDIASTEIQILQYMTGRGFVQDIYPNLSADEREFLISGTTPEEWEQMFGNKDEERAGQPDVSIDWDEQDRMAAESEKLADNPFSGQGGEY